MKTDATRVVGHVQHTESTSITISSTPLPYMSIHIWLQLDVIQVENIISFLFYAYNFHHSEQPM